MYLLKQLLTGLICFSLAIPLQFSYAASGLDVSGGSSEESSAPVKVNLSISPNVTGLNPHEAAALKSIAEAVGQSLYYYATFPIVLPQTVFNNGAQIIELGDLYQKPTSNELHRLGGDDVSLTQEQLQTLKKQGLVVIPSVEYPGMFHVWKVSVFLQKGSDNIQLSLNKDKAESFWQLDVGFSERIFGIGSASFSERPFGNSNINNVADGVTNIFGALKDTLGLFVGIAEKAPRFTAHEVEEMVNKELQLRIVKEAELENEKDPYLRLFYESVSEQAARVLVEIQQTLEADWSEKSVVVETELRQKFRDISDLEIEDAINERKNADLMARIQAQSAKFEAISPGLTQALFDHAKTVQLIFVAEQKLANDILQAREAFESDYRAKHPTTAQMDQVFKGSSRYRNQSGAQYLQEIIDSAFFEIQQNLQDEAYKKISEDLRSQGLATQAQMLERHYQSIRKDYAGKSERDAVRADVESITEPVRRIQYTSRIWNSNNWNVESYTNEEGKTTYSADKYEYAEVTSAHPFWRWWAAAQATKSNFKSGLYHLVVSNFINGPVGLKSLVYSQPFSSGKVLDSRTGEVVPSRDTNETLVSRYRNLWSSVRERKARFEQESNSGLSKNFRRPFHVAWSYGVVGGLGSLVLGPGQVTLTALNAAVTGVGVATSAVWAPMASIFMLGFGRPFIYDSSAKRQNRFFPIVSTALVKFGVKGIMQTGAGLLGAVYHSSVGAGRLGFAYIRSGVRTSWDWLTRNLVLRPFGNVPYRDNSVFRRVSGPGLSSDYFFQLKPEISVLGLQATLEQQELRRYTESTQAEIQKPVNEYKGFLKRLFSQVVSANSFAEGVVDVVNKTTATHTELLNKAVSQRNGLYNQLVGEGVDKSIIRQTAEDLNETLRLGTALVRDFYETRILKNLSEKDADKLWADLRIAKNDWESLARRLLTETFSSEFLTPLQESDKSFRFVVEHPGLRVFFDAIEGKYADTTITPVVDRPRTEAAYRQVKDLTRSLLPQVTVASLCQRYFSK